MKGLKKLALASAVALAPFAAQADLKALNDDAMGDVTGQAGVTIELETKIDIGEVRYQDEGFFTLKGVHLGGQNDADPANSFSDADGDGSFDGVVSALNDVKIDIDIEANGDAVIDVTNTDGNGSPIDFAMLIEEVGLESQDGAETTLLASNITMVGNLSRMNLTVDNSEDALNIDVGFNITDMDMDIDFLGIGIRNLQVYGSDYLEETAAGGATSASALYANATFGLSKAAGAAPGGNDALAISVSDISMDVIVEEIIIGGANIGSLTFDDLVISETSLVVYGR